MFVVIQTIQLRWTKADRGSPGADGRGRIADALPLGDAIRTAPGDARVFWDHHLYEPPFERDQHTFGFHSLPYEHGPLHLSAASTGLDIRYTWDPAHVGAPRRTYHDATGAEVPMHRRIHCKLGEMARIQWSGRSGGAVGESWDHHQWSYIKVTANVIALPDLAFATTDILLRRFPDHLADDTVSLRHGHR